MTAEAVSLGGLSGTVHRFGIIDNVSPFPNSKLEIISNVIKDENNLLLRNPIDLEITLSGSTESLDNIGQQHFFANEFAFLAPTTLIFDSNGIVTGAKILRNF